MLKEIQQNFTDTIFGLKKSVYPLERLDIYKKTIFENCRHALQLTFPGVWCLLGEECANTAAYLFLKNKENFPKTGCLDDWGAQFPIFLGGQKELRSVPYIKDYAAYEWLQHCSYHAVATEGILPDILMTFSEEALEKLRFLLAPSCFLFSSYYPIDEIENSIKNDSLLTMSVIKSQKTAIIICLKYKVTTFWVPVDQWFFLSIIQEGVMLQQAVESTMARYPNFNLPEALHFLFKVEHLISEVRCGS